MSYDDLTGWVRKRKNKQVRQQQSVLEFYAQLDEDLYDVEERHVVCMSPDCEEIIRVEVNKLLPEDKNPRKICHRCKIKDHEFGAKSSEAFTEEERKKVAAYDPDKRGYLKGLDSPPRILKGREFKKAAKEIMANYGGKNV